MPKKTLYGSWIHQGVIYGPGEADVPDEAVADLEAKGAFTNPAQESKPAAPPDGGRARKD